MRHFIGLAIATIVVAFITCLSAITLNIALTIDDERVRWEEWTQEVIDREPPPVIGVSPFDPNITPFSKVPPEGIFLLAHDESGQFYRKVGSVAFSIRWDDEKSFWANVEVRELDPNTIVYLIGDLPE